MSVLSVVSEITSSKIVSIENGRVEEYDMMNVRKLG